MTRRSFISSLLAGVIAPAFLPGAGRKWVKCDALWEVNPNWINAEYEMIVVGIPKDIAKWVVPVIYERLPGIYDPEILL